MLENTEHLRDSAWDLIETKKIINKVRRTFFTIFWEPEDIINYLNEYRSYKNT